MKHSVSIRKSIHLATAAVLGGTLIISLIGTTFARGLGAGIGAGADVGVGGPGLNAAGNAGGGFSDSVGGRSSGHMSTEGLSDTNRPNSADPDTGLGRAKDRANQEGLENGDALNQPPDQDADTSTSGDVEGHGQAGKHTDKPKNAKIWRKAPSSSGYHPLESDGTRPPGS